MNKNDQFYRMFERLGMLYPRVVQSSANPEIKTTDKTIEALKTYCPDILAGIKATCQNADKAQLSYFVAILAKQEIEYIALGSERMIQAFQKMQHPERLKELESILYDLDSKREAYIKNHAPLILKGMSRDMKDREQAEILAGQIFDKDIPEDTIQALNFWHES